MTEREEIQFARGQVARFTLERPMVVPPRVLADMKDSGHFDDLLVRVIENKPIPL